MSTFRYRYLDVLIENKCVKILDVQGSQRKNMKNQIMTNFNLDETISFWFEASLLLGLVAPLNLPKFKDIQIQHALRGLKDFEELKLS